MVAGAVDKKGSSKVGRPKFFEGEKVLCFEPDPSKVRVVYDAKIMRIAAVDVPVNDGETTPGREKMEQQEQFLVHFQGWNTSWDRFVPEGFLLKATPDNKTMQRDMMEKAEHLKKSAKKLKRPSRTKRYSCSADEDVTLDGPESSNDVESGDDWDASATAHARGKFRKDEAAVCGPSDVPLRLTERLKRHLENDHFNVTKKKRPNPVPANPNVVAVLEDYVRHYAAAQLAAYEKQRNKAFYTAHRKEGAKQYLESALDRISLSKEVAEGLRIMVDVYLEKHLLYEEERESHGHCALKKPLRERRRCTLSESPVERPAVAAPAAKAQITPEAGQTLQSINQWRLLPDDKAEEFAKLPSVLFGPIYLLRLFVKLPEIFGKMGMPSRKLKLITKYMDSILEYLGGHSELFDRLN